MDEGGRGGGEKGVGREGWIAWWGRADVRTVGKVEERGWMLYVGIVGVGCGLWVVGRCYL